MRTLSDIVDLIVYPVRLALWLCEGVVRFAFGMLGGLVCLPFWYVQARLGERAATLKERMFTNHVHDVAHATPDAP